MNSLFKTRILVIGAGDIGTGVIARLHRAGFQPVAADLPQPMAIRHTVSLCSAVNEGEYRVEELKAVHVNNDPGKTQLIRDIEHLIDEGKIPVVTSDIAELINHWKPEVIVDARILKVESTLKTSMAPLVIGLGPGFVAGDHSHAVIETMRGHYMGRVIRTGHALDNTGVPGNVGGETAKRVIHAPASGVLKAKAHIGDKVAQDDIIATIDSTEVKARISGVLRGLIHNDTEVVKGLKIADVDPRCDPEACYTISDKAVAIGGAVLEAVCHWLSDTQ